MYSHSDVAMSEILCPYIIVSGVPSCISCCCRPKRHGNIRGDVTIHQ